MEERVKKICANKKDVEAQIEELRKARGGLLYSVAEIYKVIDAISKGYEEIADRNYMLESTLLLLSELMKKCKDVDVLREKFINVIEEVLSNEYIRND